jgi:hypothetical protein
MKYIFTEAQIKKVIDSVISEQSKMGCTFTIEELMAKNKQGLKMKPKQFEIISVEGKSSVSVNSKVSITQKITMGKGEIVFKDIPDYGQATISCDGNTAKFGVSWE